MRTRLGRTASVVGCVYFLANGLWAFFAPRSFFNYLAQWPPYNEHFLRDAGSLTLGIGIALALPLARFQADLAALAGAAVAGVAHAVSHVIDYGDAGRESDPYLLGLLALLLVAALVREWRISA